MKKDEAIKLMESSKNVDDWNANRDKVMHSHNSTTGKLADWFSETIDGGGLIVKVAKKNKWPQQIAGS